jgi:hypothetical protein
VRLCNLADSVVGVPTLRKVVRKERVDERVCAPPLEDEIRAKVAFTLEAGALQDALRRSVVGFNERLDARETCVRERPPSDECDRARREATAAGTPDHPVAHLDVARLGPEHEDNGSKSLVRRCVGDRQSKPSASVNLAGTVVPSGMRGSRLASSTHLMSVSAHRRRTMTPSASGGSGYESEAI